MSRPPDEPRDCANCTECRLGNYEIFQEVYVTLKSRPWHKLLRNTELFEPVNLTGIVKSEMWTHRTRRYPGRRKILRPLQWQMKAFNE